MHVCMYPRFLYFCVSSYSLHFILYTAIIILSFSSCPDSTGFPQNMPSCWKCAHFCLISCSVLLLAAATVVSPQASLKMHNFTQWSNQIVEKREHCLKSFYFSAEIALVSKVHTAGSWSPASARVDTLLYVAQHVSQTQCPLYSFPVALVASTVQWVIRGFRKPQGGKICHHPHCRTADSLYWVCNTELRELCFLCDHWFAVCVVLHAEP